ncbi:hypothetical protein GCM10007304_46550 [Rhodococcoides trifolii]|uniref:Uncharacterized protein n=1 Tax=Rhodococcoides trifolii TaxID=908250 RepID=A0A917G7M8_9NOCA|nr:hypothetical protein GCM10007304_46550 [Rhodococcus trifolii]
MLALIAVSAIAYGTREITRGVTASVGDTMDPRFVACGSVLNPIPSSDLEVSFPTSYPLEPRSTLQPIPDNVLSPRCDDRLAVNENFAGGAVLGGLIVLARSIGHAMVASGRRAAPGSRE